MDPHGHEAHARYGGFYCPLYRSHPGAPPPSGNAHGGTVNGVILQLRKRNSTDRRAASLAAVPKTASRIMAPTRHNNSALASRFHEGGK